jgi:hypothetical protein
MEVDEAALTPEITPLLRQNGIKPERLVEILRCDVAPEAQAFIKTWDSLTPATRSIAGIEAVAVASGITPRRLYEVFAGAALMQSKESVSLRIALALPLAVQMTIKDAMTAKGHFAREHLYKAARVLPTPKGSTTNINFGKQGELEQGDDDDSGATLEPADTFMMRASKAMGQKALPAPVVEAEVIEEEDE